MTQDERRFDQMAREEQLVEQAYADYMLVLREHQQRSNTCGPHCDMLMLHSPSVCPVCDTYASDLQAARTRMNIAFSDQQPTDGQRPCPATQLRPYEQISRWPGNRPEGYSW